jgi:hypothetical protein
MTSLLGLAAIGAAALVAPARAQPAPGQDHPPFLPTRDVAVTYRLSGGPGGGGPGGGGPGGGGQETRMYYSATAGKLRIDTPNGAGYTVLDRNAGQQTMVMTQQRAYATMPLPPGAADGFILNDTMAYRPEGQRTIDGLTCTEWGVSSQQTTGRACVTADGVLLSGSGSQQGPQGTQETALTATSVQYGPQPSSLFQPPPGYRQLTEEQMEQMMGPPPGQDGGPPSQPGGPGGGYGAPPPGGGYGAPPPGGGYGAPPPGGGYGAPAGPG